MTHLFYDIDLGLKGEDLLKTGVIVSLLCFIISTFYLGAKFALYKCGWDQPDFVIKQQFVEKTWVSPTKDALHPLSSNVPVM